MDNSYAKAYSEVLEVLKYIPKDDYDKIPKKTIQLLKSNYDETSDFVYNIGIPFEKQEISRKAKIILAILYRNCWITEDEKIEIAKKEKENLKSIEEEKRKKYNPNKLFEKEKVTEKVERKENNYLVIKEKWYHKLIQKIKSLFKV